jgi:hypothetical protein
VPGEPVAGLESGNDDPASWKPDGHSSYPEEGSAQAGDEPGGDSSEGDDDPSEE